MMSLLKKEREFIVEEKDVTTVLAVINHHLRYPNQLVGDCGWDDQPSKWYVIFDATDKKYGRIVRDLSEIGEFRLEVETTGVVDTYFERTAQA